MKRIRYIAIYGVLIIGLMGCKKEVADPGSSNPNVLPPLTHEGKNTFGCKVNGEVWVAYAPFTVGGPTSMESIYNSSSGYFQLIGKRVLDEDNVFETIKILCDSVFIQGDYPMRINHLSTRGFTDYKGNYNCSKYYYDTTLISRVDITFFSPSQRIISGTFEMDLVNPSCPGDTVKIREGRFDWRY